MSLTITEACELLEGDPQIQLDRLDVTTNVRGQRVSIRVGDGCGALYFRDQTFDLDAWSRFGKAVRNSSSLHTFDLVRSGVADAIDGDLLVAAALCIDAFFAEVKRNKSIATATIELTGLLINDVTEFIEKNEALKELVLESRERVSLQESTILSWVIQSAKLEAFNIQFCSFEDDESFERMLEGCSSVNRRLDVTCEDNSECTAVAVLLRDPSCELKELMMMLNREHSEDGDSSSSLDVQQATKDILESLSENTNLKELRLYAPLRASVCFDSDNLLCDPKSIDSIINSNHTLESINIGYAELSTFTKECLMINRNPDKNKVVRDKILRFYFVDEFDVSQFSNMTLSVLPEVMRFWTEHSAIYRLLKYMPELCNVSDGVP
jgi:hypothetical protein